MPVAIPVLGQVNYEPVVASYTKAGNGSVPQAIRWPEAATLTIRRGVPVMIDGSGNAAEATFGSANLVLGFTEEAGHNLTTAATPDSGYSEATPPNQTGKTIPVGAWIRDGTIDVAIANAMTVFTIALKTGQVYTQAMAGLTYGITKDATTGFWFLDNTVTSGNSAVAQVIDVEDTAPNTVASGARVFFQVVSAKRAL